ncbi:hypothetical protein F4813DRAFT_368192 [Daldinia decipiens]|uniref:uncharacterized protein n=1 Tax=Daldinia decipiens TaxID=326647 RepID=UPI0020C347BB|nr:uncharacterized protein F4813DRAFT_368192 [Daldinia decipiens]KAI1655239.1 hypothetical protein F4813DRAFT_368192 [Daldinia decipiens]
MDLPRESIGINDKDLQKVFKYEPGESTVVTRLEGSKQKSTIESINTDDRWEEWINMLPPPDSLNSGLILILARRPGQMNLSMRSTNCPAKEDRGLSCGNKPVLNNGGSRSVRTLPFSPKVFKLMSEKFYIHGSIARVINRSDVPHFSRVEMEIEIEGSTHPAYAYNCRTTNAWEADLALTVTHFPRSGLTYAILFGCPVSIENEVIARLNYPGVEASYPLLLPGIFAELERNRHLNIIEDYINNIEEKIFELDYQLPVEQQIRCPSIKGQSKDKRSQWLDTAYLKNSLVTWNTQLFKMAGHIGELRNTLFGPHERKYSRIGNDDIPCVGCDSKMNMLTEPICHPLCETSCIGPVSGYYQYRTIPQNWKSVELRNHRMRIFGARINSRLQAMMEEYEDKIRECAMRLDGMAMATQWSHGDTNVEIALATGRDSRHMRSIAVVTMVFLPGTFCASVFSMQFFNWFPGDDGNTMVSRYFWIYVLVTIAMTLLTLGVWYYVSWKEKQQKQHNADSQEGMHV